MKIQRSVFIFSAFLLFFVLQGYAQKKASKMDLNFMLVEYYGQDEFLRKSECCSAQIERRKFELKNSYNLQKTLKAGQEVASNIETVKYMPKGTSAYENTSSDLVEMILTQKFNVLISDLKSDKNVDKIYSIEGTDYFLLVKSEETISKEFRLNKK